MHLLCKTDEVIHRIVRFVSRFRLLRLSALSIIDMHVKASDAPVTGVDSVGLLGDLANPPGPGAPEFGGGREPETGFRAGGTTRPGPRSRSFRIAGAAPPSAGQTTRAGRPREGRGWRGRRADRLRPSAAVVGNADAPVRGFAGFRRTGALRASVRGSAPRVCSIEWGIGASRVAPPGSGNGA